MTVAELVEAQGFAEFGWADANSEEAIDNYGKWLDEGRDGPLDYLRRNRALRERPHELLEGGGAGFLVALMPLPFFEGSSRRLPAGRAWIARYARGRDYHKVMRRALTRILEGLSASAERPYRGRALVDSAPVLERDLAVQAGLGWIGRNGMLLHPELGSSFLIGSLLLDRRPDGIPEAEPMADHCGRCRDCLDACPTGALDEQSGLDAGRCISTWSIEDRELPDADQVASWGNHLFGCDICQDVCPWNSRVPGTADGHPFEFRPGLDSPTIEGFLTTLLEEPDVLLEGSALRRAGRTGLLRNSLAAARSRGIDLPDDLLERWRAEGDGAAAVIDWSRSLVSGDPA